MSEPTLYRGATLPSAPLMNSMGAPSFRSTYSLANPGDVAADVFVASAQGGAVDGVVGNQADECAVGPFQPKQAESGGPPARRD